MRARKQAKIYSRDRVALESVIPLETPFSVEIDVCSACNFRCDFCFHADTGEIGRSGVRFGRMTMSLFEKVLADLHRFPERVKKVRLFEFGEPLLHPKLPEMIRAVWDAGVADYIEITTNGALLTEDLNLRLIEAGLSRINISVSGLTEADYRRVSRHSLDMSSFIAGIKHLYEHRGDCHVYVKLADDGSLTGDEEEEFYRLFGDICDKIFVERLAPIWRDTDINANVDSAVGPYGQKLGHKEVCPLIFTRMVINHDGIVVACCVDWKRQYVIGDVSTESAYEIWNGAALRELQIRHLRRAREEVGLCRGCTALMSCTIDDIDAHADELLERLAPRSGGEA